MPTSPSLSEMKLNLSEASEDPSQNILLTSQSGRDMTVLQLPACQADFNASLSQDQAPSSTPQQMPSFTSPSSLPRQVSQCNSPDSIGSVVSKESSSRSIPTLSPNINIVKDEPAKVELK